MLQFLSVHIPETGDRRSARQARFSVKFAHRCFLIHFFFAVSHCCCVAMCSDFAGYKRGREFDAHEFLLYLLAKLTAEAV